MDFMTNLDFLRLNFLYRIASRNDIGRCLPPESYHTWDVPILAARAPRLKVLGVVVRPAVSWLYAILQYPINRRQESLWIQQLRLSPSQWSLLFIYFLVIYWGWMKTSTEIIITQIIITKFNITCKSISKEKSN